MKDFETHTFLKLLDSNRIKYHYEDKWLVVDGDDEGFIYLYNKRLRSLPDYIKFNCEKYVQLSNNFLTSLPDHIEFNNGGNVYLHNNELNSLPDNIEFNNNGNVNLSKNELTSLPNNIKFNNKGIVYLHNNELESLPENIDEFYDRLNNDTKKYIQKTFPDHWFINKGRFNL